MLCRRYAAVLLVLSIVWSGPALAQRDLTPFDIATMKSVSGAYPSPDGSSIAYTRSVPRGPEDGPGGSYSELFLLGGTHGATPLVTGKSSVGGVSWHPGGRLISFLQRRDGDSGRQLYTLSMSGGEAQRAFEAPYGVSQYSWSPDGMSVAFTASLPAPEARAKARSAGFRQTVYDEDWNPIGLFVWDHESREIRQIDIPGSAFALAWTPDANGLIVAIAPRSIVDDFYMFKRLHHVDLETGAVRKVVDNPGKLGAFSVSPDGSTVAYISAVDVRDPHSGMLFLADLESGDVTDVLPDWEGMVHSFEWKDDRTVRAVISRGVESVLTDLRVDRGTFDDLPTVDGAFGSVHTAGSTVVAIVSGPSHPGELYQLEDGAWNRLTTSNKWLEEVELGTQAPYAFEASDGVTVEGILMWPKEFQEGTEYPLVIVVHGGPESHYNNSWLTGYSSWGQLLATKGYFVWYPNYRSSTGRGIAFAKDDHGDLAGREFDDQLDAIAHFADKGWVDADRVGLGGGSYGGYAAAWAATKHTDAYAAAVSFVPITHVATKWMTTDIPWEYYYVHYEEKSVFDQWDYLEERSPLTYAAQSRTPLLLAGGTSDTRVHPSQPLMLYRAMTFSNDTPVRLVQYPDQGHGNSLNVYRYDYMLRSLRWFEYYLEDDDRRGAPLPPMDLDYGPWMK